MNCTRKIVELPEQISHCGGEKEYEITIKNTGLLYQEIVLATIAGELSDEEFSLEEGEERTINLAITLTESTEINVSSALGLQTFNIPTNTAEYCTVPAINKESFVVRNAFAQLTIPIENEGFADGTFELSIDNNAELNSNELFIPVGETRNALINLDLSDREFGTYAFNLVVEGETTVEKTLSVEYKDKTIFQKGIRFLNNNPCLYLLGILSFLTIIALLLWIFINPKGKGNVKVTGIILAAILIITAIVLGLTKGTPEPLYPELTTEPTDLYFEIYEGETLTININEYFKDEDADNLTYKVLGDDINYDLNKGIIELRDGIGEYEIIFEAYDGEDYAESPEALIIIKEKPQITFLGFLVKYCLWLSWLALLLLSVL